MVYQNGGQCLYWEIYERYGGLIKYPSLLSMEVEISNKHANKFLQSLKFVTIVRLSCYSVQYEIIDDINII